MKLLPENEKMAISALQCSILIMNIPTSLELVHIPGM